MEVRSDFGLLLFACVGVSRLSTDPFPCEHSVSRKEPPKEPAAAGLPQSTVMPQSIPTTSGVGGGGW